jgi:hypothetical protein
MHLWMTPCSSATNRPKCLVYYKEDSTSCRVNGLRKTRHGTARMKYGEYR